MRIFVSAWSTHFLLLSKTRIQILRRWHEKAPRKTQNTIKGWLWAVKQMKIRKIEQISVLQGWHLPFVPGWPSAFILRSIHEYQIQRKQWKFRCVSIIIMGHLVPRFCFLYFSSCIIAHGQSKGFSVICFFCSGNSLHHTENNQWLDDCA